MYKIVLIFFYISSFIMSTQIQCSNISKKSFIKSTRIKNFQESNCLTSVQETLITLTIMDINNEVFNPSTAISSPKPSAEPDLKQKPLSQIRKEQARKKAGIENCIHQQKVTHQAYKKII